MPLKILFLDDDATRCDLAMEWFGGEDLTIVNTAIAAVRALEREDTAFNLIFLDHDLDPYVNEAPFGTGRDVADWLAERSTRFVAVGPTPKVVIHSWNPDGGKQMFDVLHDAGFDVDRAWFGPSLKGYVL